MQSEHDGFRFWQLLSLVVLMVVAVPLGVIALDSPTAWANPPLGTVLAGPFVPAGAPCATGNGRGMAFDGTDLYYTIVGSSTIYKIDTTGACLGAIGVPAGDPRVSAGGPLAWDGTHLWTVDYSAALTMYRVDPVTGATAASCSIPGVNPGHPALAGLDFPDGLHWTGIPGSELVLSGEISIIGRPTAVVFMSPACGIASFFTSPPPFDGQWSGVAFDGAMLWHSDPLATSIEQTDLAGVLTGVTFPSAGLQLEDLEYDPVTFAPLCAVWGNEATGGPNRIIAFEVPCRPPAVACVETVNPSGKNVPKAPGTGQNEDGFYQLRAKAAVPPAPSIFLVDTGADNAFGTADDFVYGPFSSGTRVKYTEANGITPPDIKPGPGAIAFRIKGNGDAAVFAVDAVGNVSAPAACRVPPPPK